MPDTRSYTEKRIIDYLKAGMDMAKSELDKSDQPNLLPLAHQAHLKNAVSDLAEVRACIKMCKKIHLLSQADLEEVISKYKALYDLL